MYDVDGNGVIDIQEMTKIVQVSFAICNSRLGLGFSGSSLWKQMFTA